MKNLAFLLVVVLVVAVSIIIVNKPKSYVSNVSNVSNTIEGAWLYISYERISNGYINEVIPGESTYSEMKIWTKNHYSYVGKRESTGINFGGGGAYTLDGNKYAEHVAFSPIGRDVGSIIHLFLEIKNDTLTQIWPADESANYDEQNCNIIKMVRMDYIP